MEVAEVEGNGHSPSTLPQLPNEIIWRCIEADVDKLRFNDIALYVLRDSVCLHGALHWACDNVWDSILVFDLGEEKFRAIPFPKDVGAHASTSMYNFARIVDVGGCLAVIDENDYNSRNLGMLRLWILKDYKNRVWVKETVSFPPHWPKSCYYLTTRNTIHTDELLIQSSPSRVQASVHFHDTKSNSFGRCSIVLPEHIYRNGCDVELSLVTSYHETLAPLRS